MSEPRYRAKAGAIFEGNTLIAKFNTPEMRDMALDKLNAYDELRNALERFTEWFWGHANESPNELFERIGEEFYAATGYLRPGKNDRSGTHEERSKARNEWVEKKHDAAELKCRELLTKYPKAK